MTNTSENRSDETARGAALQPRLFLAHTAIILAAALICPLQMFVGNLDQRPAGRDVILTILPALVLAGVGWLGFGLWLRDLRRSTLATLLLLVWFFTYGHLYALTSPYGVRHRWLCLFWSAAFLAGLTMVKRARNTGAVATINRFAGVLLGCMVALHVGSWATWHFKSNSVAGSTVIREHENLANLPDIFFIVVDGYARDDMLARYAHFDNHAFLEELRNRGFMVRREARSNYSQTRFSIPSMLSMEYLDVSQNSGFFAKVTNSEVTRLLRLSGYRARFIGSAYPPFASSSQSDYDSHLAIFPTEYFIQFARTTVLSAASDALSVRWETHGDIPRVIQYQLQQLVLRPHEPRPLFTFAHLMLPHSPFYYGRNGAHLESEVVAPKHAAVYSDDELAAYVGQIEYLNQQLLKIIDAIYARKSRVPPIVLIQADHGGGFLGMPGTPSPEQLAERMSIFSAVHLPESMRADFHDSLTPVNQFRVILRRLIGAPLENLPDRSYYSAYESPEQLIEYAPQQEKKAE